MTKRAGISISPGSQNRCWGCGCSEQEACPDPDTGGGCAWANEKQDFCTNCAMLYASLVFNVPGIVRIQLAEAA